MATHVSPLDIDFDTIDTSRFEYIGGQLLERPVPKPLHSRVQGNLIELLGPLARQHGCRFGPELSIDKHNEKGSEWLTPDNALYHDPPKKSLGGNALPDDIELVVEILSPDQSLSILLDKTVHYLNWGVPFIWIIDPYRQQAEIYRSVHDSGEMSFINADVSVNDNLFVLFRDGKTSLTVPLADALA
jgi:Uma2 family endonuclease